MTTGKTVLEQVIPAVSKSDGDYYGKDGLLYCGKRHTPKEAFFANNLSSTDLSERETEQGV